MKHDKIEPWGSSVISPLKLIISEYFKNLLVNSKEYFEFYLNVLMTSGLLFNQLSQKNLNIF